MLGSWRLEQAGRTVTITFLADGTVDERVNGEDGRPLRRVGGNWALEGAGLKLDGYVSSRGGVARPASWYFADGARGLVLVGNDSGNPDDYEPLRRLAGPP